ncbi:F-box protein SKIP22 [Cardamine amara subsp. amara]|uniref:F-box protein SKIP22 n=1 Tax=Cardamine amara subsp. amara TaxID=228776 RepID=A0ABD1BGZ6_CARAN
MPQIHIPTELKMKILESLPGVDIARVSCVCSEYRDLASDNSLWKQKCLDSQFQGFVIEEEAELRGDLVDWKAKFVELWRQMNTKEPRKKRTVSCNPNFGDAFFHARRDRGSAACLRRSFGS